jgi:hypothetical protein
MAATVRPPRQAAPTITLVVKLLVPLGIRTFLFATVM